MPGASADRCRKLYLAFTRCEWIQLRCTSIFSRLAWLQGDARGVPGGMGRESPGAEFMLGNLVLCHSKFKDICLNLTCDNAFTCFYREICSIFPVFFSISIPGRRARKPASQPPTQQASHTQPHPATASKQASQPKRTLNKHVKPTLSNA